MAALSRIIAAGSFCESSGGGPCLLAGDPGEPLEDRTTWTSGTPGAVGNHCWRTGVSGGAAFECGQAVLDCPDDESQIAPSTVNCTSQNAPGLREAFPCAQWSHVDSSRLSAIFLVVLTSSSFQASVRMLWDFASRVTFSSTLRESIAKS